MSALLCVRRAKSCPPTAWCWSMRPLTLGRDAGHDVTLPGDEISQRHAELRLAAGALSIRDLGSRNGFVRGVQLNESPLAARDAIRLGEWVGVVRTPISKSP
jgi:pSer/pThr/pTyr-binding forkhead associated (FHA) protein